MVVVGVGEEQVGVYGPAAGAKLITEIADACASIEHQQAFAAADLE